MRKLDIGELTEEIAKRGLCKECAPRVAKATARALEASAEEAQKWVDEQAAAYEEYIALLEEEINEIEGVAIAHGWKSTRVEAGEKARAKIAALKQFLTKKER